MTNATSKAMYFHGHIAQAIASVITDLEHAGFKSKDLQVRNIVTTPEETLTHITFDGEVGLTIDVHLSAVVESCEYCGLRISLDEIDGVIGWAANDNFVCQSNNGGVHAPARG